MFRVALAATALALSMPAAAMEVLQLTKGQHARWTVGDKSKPVLTSDGRLGVVLTVQKSPNTGQSYYVISWPGRSRRDRTSGASICPPNSVRCT
jgi:hypothetical protein